MFNNKKRGKRILSLFFAIVLIVSSIMITNAYTEKESKTIGLSGEILPNDNADIEIGSSGLNVTPDEDDECPSQAKL